MSADRPALHPERVGARILEFLRSEILGPDDEVGVGDELLSSGLLDSMGALRLATFIEEEFGVRLKPSDYVVENFQTVERLADCVIASTGDAG